MKIQGFYSLISRNNKLKLFFNHLDFYPYNWIYSSLKPERYGISHPLLCKLTWTSNKIRHERSCLTVRTSV